MTPRGTLYGTLYGALMRFSHRFNWHHTRTCYPDGDTMLVCDWCGMRYVKARRSGCHCEPGRCMAPKIMGRQQPCLDPMKATMLRSAAAASPQGE